MSLNLMISLLNFSLLDWVLVGILLYSVVHSVLRGFIREILVLASVLAAILLASWFYRGFSAVFKDVVRTENLALFLGFSVIFAGTLLAGVVVTRLAAKFVRFARLEWADRVLGGAFGFARGWLICAVLLLVLTAFGIQTDRVRNSELSPLFLPGSRVVAVITPYELKAKFLVGYRAIEWWWRDN